MGNPFCHVQLHVGDTSEAKKFYGALLDRTFDDIKTLIGPYTTVGAGGSVMGGITGNRAGETPSHWLAYIEVDDVAAAAKRAVALGGTILQDKIDIPSGSFVIVADPTGAAVGLFERAAKRGGAWSFLLAAPLQVG